jgi:hypothetical protein
MLIVSSFIMKHAEEQKWPSSYAHTGCNLCIKKVKPRHKQCLLSTFIVTKINTVNCFTCLHSPTYPTELFNQSWKDTIPQHKHVYPFSKVVSFRVSHPNITQKITYGPGPHYRGFAITIRHTTLRGTSLDEINLTQRPVRYNTNTHKRQILTSPAGFKPAIPASERPQTHDLDSKVTSTGDMQLQPQGPKVPMGLFALYPSTLLPCVSHSSRKYVTPSRRRTNAAAIRHATYRQHMAARHNKTIRKSKVLIKINDTTISLWCVNTNEFSFCY